MVQTPRIRSMEIRILILKVGLGLLITQAWGSETIRKSDFGIANSEIFGLLDHLGEQIAIEEIFGSIESLKLGYISWLVWFFENCLGGSSWTLLKRVNLPLPPTLYRNICYQQRLALPKIFGDIPHPQNKNPQVKLEKCIYTFFSQILSVNMYGVGVIYPYGFEFYLNGPAKV